MLIHQGYYFLSLLFMLIVMVLIVRIPKWNLCVIFCAAFLVAFLWSFLSLCWFLCPCGISIAACLWCRALRAKATCFMARCTTRVNPARWGALCLKPTPIIWPNTKFGLAKITKNMWSLGSTPICRWRFTRGAWGIIAGWLQNCTLLWAICTTKICCPIVWPWRYYTRESVCFCCCF